MSGLTHEDRQEHIARCLPGVVERINASGGASYYLGHGKDGHVFRMFNPEDPLDASLDSFAIKIWNDRFRFRGQEVEIQREVCGVGGGLNVPTVHAVDFERSCFEMDRVPGVTMYGTVFGPRRFLSEDMLYEVEFAIEQLRQVGVCHNDPHYGNYMITEPEFADGPQGEVLVDGVVWLIDFGRSVHKQTDADLRQVREELSGRVVDDPRV